MMGIFWEVIFLLRQSLVCPINWYVNYWLRLVMFQMFLVSHWGFQKSDNSLCQGIFRQMNEMKAVEKFLP